MGPERSLSRSEWAPVHQYPEAPGAIDLTPVVKYRVTPLDGSLKNLLARWAFLAGKRLQYEPGTDWQVHRDAARVESASLDDALKQLATAYSIQGVELSVREGVLRASLDGGVDGAQ